MSAFFLTFDSQQYLWIHVKHLYIYLLFHIRVSILRYLNKYYIYLLKRVQMRAPEASN